MSQENDNFLHMLESEVEAAINVYGQDDSFMASRSAECSDINFLRSFDSTHPDALTIETILGKSGGFGRFQWIALILLTILRNFGNA